MIVPNLRRLLREVFALGVREERPALVEEETWANFGKPPTTS